MGNLEKLPGNVSKVGIVSGSGEHIDKTPGLTGAGGAAVGTVGGPLNRPWPDRDLLLQPLSPGVLRGPFARKLRAHFNFDGCENG